jgi:hypothetical protein
MAKYVFDSLAPTLTLAVISAALLTAPAAAQVTPPSAQQRATAAQVASDGIALSELAANAPTSYSVQSGDTLWAIAKLFLKSPWRWPELWGMNLTDIQNPHRIYPGQMLYLVTANGRAMLRSNPLSDAQASLNTVKLSPHTRTQSISSTALPTLKSHLIEPFLVEPIVVDETGLSQAARIVAAQDSRVLLTRGDRAYARGPAGAELMDDPSQKFQILRVFRNATPLKDPISAAVLGYEAQYIGKARLVQSESTQSSTAADGKSSTSVVPASIDIFDAKEEIRVGDRLLPEPAQKFQNFVPHAAPAELEARILSVYGSAVVNAAQNQVVTINRGTRDGIESGHMLAIMKAGELLQDKTQAIPTQLKLPDERNGLLMVFRPFEKVSYALVLDITSGVKVGDRLISPR